MAEIMIAFKDLDSLTFLRPSICMFLEETLKEDAPLVEVAVNEAINNAIKHGKGLDKQLITVKLKHNHKRIIIRIKDEGGGFESESKLKALTKRNLDSQINIDNLDENGRGIFIMSMIADKLIYNRKGNELLFVKNI